MENTEKKEVAVDRVALEPRPLTVFEEIDKAIEHHNRIIAQLLALRDTVQGKGLGALRMDLIRQLQYPGSMF